MRTGYYILKGKTIHKAASVEEWASTFQDTGSRTVAKAMISPGVEVSTVFLGLDHNFSDSGPPLLFETLVFGGPLADEMDRYATYDEARAGHFEMVARCRKEGGAPIDPWEERVSGIFYDDDVN